MKKKFEIIDGRLTIYEGNTCPCKKCKRNRTAKFPIQISDFDCGLYIDCIEEGDEVWRLKELVTSKGSLVYLRIQNQQQVL